MNYKPGDKVRIARHLYGPEKCRIYIGQEGVVLTDKCNTILSFSGYIEGIHLVQLAHHGQLWCLPDELEPILPKGDPLVAMKDLPPELEAMFDRVFKQEDTPC